VRPPPKRHRLVPARVTERFDERVGDPGALLGRAQLLGATRQLGARARIGALRELAIEASTAQAYREMGSETSH
jgi:hypothetical protein